MLTIYMRIKCNTKMKQETIKKLQEAESFCDENDKSTEFMLEFMQDFAGVDLDCVMNYLQKKYKQNNK